MIKLHKFTAGFVAVAAVSMVAGAAQAQSRGQIVAAPAVVAPAPAATPAATPAQPTSASRGVVIVNPTPLPPLPPNFCNRGNSGGVSRC